MAFCTNCGAQLTEGARFCVTCGQAVRADAFPPPLVPPPVQEAPAPPLPPPPPPLQEALPPLPPPPPQMPPGRPLPETAAPPLPLPPPPLVERLDYTIVGDNLQLAQVRLKSGQEVYAEAGKMVYKAANVEWETRLTGSALSESLSLTFFHSHGEGEVGFAGQYPGKIRVFELALGQSILVQRDAFLFAQPSVQLNDALVKRLGGGEGFILEKVTGPGTVFLHAGGDFVEFSLPPGQTIQIETGSIVAFDESVAYDIQPADGIRTAVFGGEELFLATLTGPGRVIVQSMSIERRGPARPLP